MKRFLLLIVFTVFTINLTAQSPTNNILYVKKDATGTGDGSSWANAIPELADALKWANEKKDQWTKVKPLQIWIAYGTYHPMYSPEDGENFTDTPIQPRNKTFLMVNNVQLYGGFRGTETAISQRTNLPSKTNESPQDKTLLSGDFSNDDIVTPTTNGAASIANNTENAYHVIVASGKDIVVDLDGLVIAGGHAKAYLKSIKVNGITIYSTRGGGIYAESSSSSTVNLTNTTVNYNNSSSTDEASYGGGIYSESIISSVSLTNSNVNNNSSSCTSITRFSYSHGGGIYSRSSSFNPNSSYTSTVSLANSNVNNNSSIGSDSTRSYGGGIYSDAFQSSKVILMNSDVNNNKNSSTYESSGGGIYSRSYNSSLVSLTNSKVDNNKNSTTNFGGANGGGIYSVTSNNTTSPSTVLLVNSNVNHNSTSSESHSSAGGGVYCTSPSIATVSLVKSNVNNNSNTAAFSQFGYGGGIYSSSKTNFVNLTNSNVNNNETNTPSPSLNALNSIRFSGSGIFSDSSGFFSPSYSSSSPLASSSSFLTIINSNIIGNKGAHAINYDGFIDTKLTLHNSVVYNNSKSDGKPYTKNKEWLGLFNSADQLEEDYKHSYIQGETSTADGNINTSIITDPKFTNETNYDYSLQPSSPLVNKGNNILYKNGDLKTDEDMAGNPRLVGTTIDIGAYENQCNLTITATQTNVSCNGGVNGTATVDVTGGTGAYTYSWNTTPVQTTATATGLAAGTYTAMVTDANGCTATQSFTITEPNALVATADAQTNVSCNGEADGTATVSATGGAGTYTYSWNTTPVQTTATATGLAAGTYTAMVTDANGCTATQSFTITEPTALVATVDAQTNVSCNGGANGSATVSATGGTGTYTYSWSPSGGTNATATDLTAGTYTATVTDANGCFITKSVVITEPTIVLAPTATNQAYCIAEAKTVADLVVTGTDVKWYADATSTTELASTTLLTSGTYYATQTLNGCESVDRTEVQVAIHNTVAPTAANQAYCIAEAKTVADLVVTGTDVKWYTDATSTVALAPSTVLTSGTYYATQTLNGCESVDRTEVQVAIHNTVAPTATNQAYCIAEAKTVADLVVTGTDVKWYTDATSTVALAPSAVLTSGTYYATQTLNDCESVDRTEVTVTIHNTVAPTAANQAYCIAEAKTVADLVVIGTDVKWYTDATSTVALAPSAVLTSGTYYATQTLNGCESVDRTAVTVTIRNTVAPIATDQAYCIAEAKTVADLVVTGTDIKWYASSSSTIALAPTVLLVDGTTYYGTQTVNGCESVTRTAVTVTIHHTPAPSTSQPIQRFCKDTNSTIASLNINGTNIKWYDAATGGNLLSNTTSLINGTYYASQTLNGCESVLRKAVIVNVHEALPLTSTSVTVCYAATIQDVSIEGYSSHNLKWYANATTSNTLGTTHGLTTGTYYVSTFIQNMCESVRRPIQVTVLAQIAQPLASSLQVFCESGTVADLVAQVTSGGVVKWYASAKEQTPLAPSTKLLNGTYYVAQEVDGCKSTRQAVAVRVVSLTTPTMTNFVLCEGATVAKLNMSITSANYVWYVDATTSIPLSQTHTLATGYYYVAFESMGCISNRTKVHVKINERPKIPTGNTNQHFTKKSTTSDIKLNEAGVVWYGNYEDAITGADPLMWQHPLQDGTVYYGVLVSPEGCTSEPLAVTVTITLGANDFDLASLKYYPNPVTSELTVVYKDVIEEVRVYDLTGRLVKEQQFTTSEVKINMQQLSSGTYMLQIKTLQGEQFIKIVKK